MMNKSILGAVFVMLLFPSTAGAQFNEATQTVRGQVRDIASDEPMIGVTITIEK